jgi:hypothetical protein
MRYSLNEVLAIGPYSVINIDWEVHEMEKPGTWYTTVGHSSSFSANRYLFDFALLYQDLKLYGADPHTHFYLGVTHDAFASTSATTLGPFHPLVQEHADKAIIYLELRVKSYYQDEFAEQRWGVLLQLVNIYLPLKHAIKTYKHLVQANKVKTIHYLKMCRDLQQDARELL